MECTAACPHCELHQIFELERLVACRNCQKKLVPNLVEESPLSQCPLCGSSHLYRQKDFNRSLGIALVIVGIAFAYFTYGLSLIVVTILDWFLYKKVGEVGSCYRCHAQFRKSALIANLDPFNLSLFDYYKNLK